MRSGKFDSIKNGWNFRIDNKFTGTTFSDDGCSARNVQSNKTRVFIGRPMLLLGFIQMILTLSFFFWFVQE